MTNTPKKIKIGIGIDPGWTNLGLAVVAESSVPGKVVPVATKVFAPSKDPLLFVESLPSMINKMLDNNGFYLPSCEIAFLNIERYVSYSNVMSTEAENINLLIGGIRSRFFSNNPCCETITAEMHRAIDWKIKLVTTCVKKYGFDNPYTQLNKKFSMAMARFLIDPNHSYDFKTDHEADAFCLGSIPFVVHDINANAGTSTNSGT